MIEATDIIAMRKRHTSTADIVMGIMIANIAVMMIIMIDTVTMRNDTTDIMTATIAAMLNDIISIVTVITIVVMIIMTMVIGMVTMRNDMRDTTAGTIVDTAVSHITGVMASTSGTLSVGSTYTRTLASMLIFIKEQQTDKMGRNLRPMSIYLA